MQRLERAGHAAGLIVALALTGCNSIQVHLGMKLYLAKTPVSSIEVSQYKHAGIGPGEQ
jgi:hypothetical protein